MGNKISKEQLDSLLAEVGNDLDLLAKNERLAKANPDGSEDDSSGPPPGAPGDDAGSAPPGAAAPGESSAPGADASSGGPPPGAEASAPADPNAAPGGEASPPSPEELEAAYSQLPPDQLKLHYLAAKAALMKVASGAGGAPGAGGPPPGPSASPSAGPPPGPSAGAPPRAGGPPPLAQKAEMSSNPTNGGLSKAESDDLKAQVAGLSKAVKILLETPNRKAVTSISELPFLKKNDGSDAKAAPAALTKKEILAKLNLKAEDSKLSKSDRTLINQFCVGSVDVSQISHLLT